MQARKNVVDEMCVPMCRSIMAGRSRVLALKFLPVHVGILLRSSSTNTPPHTFYPSNTI